MSRIARYQDPEVYERLAGEYVLGTLRGGALRRFENLMRERSYIRLAVDTWEDQLNPLAQALPETKPDPAVWKAIEKRIKAGERTSQAGVGEASGFWQSPVLWRTATAFISLLLAVVILMPQQKSASMPMPSYVAVLESDSRVPVMVMMGDQVRRIVSVRVMETPKIGDDQDIELWSMRGQDDIPMPVGILQRGAVETHWTFSEPQWQKNIMGAKMFAASFEPKGGSPSGQPSGKMIYKGICLDLI